MHTEATEEAIVELVRRFYETAAIDEKLKPVFDMAIEDWDIHHRIVENFWSRTLLKTDRYQGSPYPIHTNLQLKIEHFDIWLTYFRQAARETLPVDAAEQAIAHAEHMSESFKVGMFFDYTPVPIK